MNWKNVLRVGEIPGLQDAVKKHQKKTLYEAIIRYGKLVTKTRESFNKLTKKFF